MRRSLPAALALAALLALSLPALADEPAKDAAKAEAKAEPAKPAPQEKASVTHHSVEIAGQRVAYTATAGTLVLRNDKDEPEASVFYVAYTADGAKDARRRPLTFVYNGGPGSSSMWLHMGSFGPVRVQNAGDQPIAPAPYTLVPNSYSLLDKTDLVFVDAVGTGWSRLAGKAEGKDFWGVDQDAAAFARFIQRYVSKNARWNSPKFLLGESYGTTRSAVLVNLLQEQGMAFNGVILVSSILDFAVFSPGLDHGYVVNLPTLAAIAWYHDKVPNKPADLDAFLTEVRGFASGAYAQALAKGDALPKPEADAVAQQLARYTGLSVKYLEEANLRVAPSRFRKELMRGDRRTVGRLDGRFEGIDFDAAGETPEYDATDAAVANAFVAAFNDYAARELKYASDERYLPTNYPNVGRHWDWKHKLPNGGGFFPTATYVAGDLAAAMRENPHLEVFSANGYYDLATPFYATEYDLAHMQLEPALRRNLVFGFYPSGHMIYFDMDSLERMKADLAKFYDSAAAH